MRIAALMSGGVDSAVAAARLVAEGHEVVGLTMRLRPPSEAAGAKSCCGLDETSDARRAADRLGFPHYVLNCEAEFSRAVISRFIEEYRRGRTPSPCLSCNHALKFDYMLTRAHGLGCDAVATGHYARIVHDADGPHLLRAVFRDKDQSYFLSGIRRDRLARILFPLGEMTKKETREEARQLGLAVAEKPESQEICFVPTDYREFLAPHLTGEAGDIVDADGRVVGRHEGYWNFTVGQRRGVGVAMGHPVYVSHIDAETNTVTVVREEELLSSGLVASEVNVLRALPSGAEVRAQIRSRHAATPARIFLEGERVRFDFVAPVSAVTPGQYVVWYDGDEVCGGAVIEHAL